MGMRGGPTLALTAARRPPTPAAGSSAAAQLPGWPPPLPSNRPPKQAGRPLRPCRPGPPRCCRLRCRCCCWRLWRPRRMLLASRAAHARRPPLAPRCTHGEWRRSRARRAARQREPRRREDGRGGAEVPVTSCAQAAQTAGRQLRSCTHRMACRVSASHRPNSASASPSAAPARSFSTSASARPTKNASSMLRLSWAAAARGSGGCQPCWGARRRAGRQRRAGGGVATAAHRWPGRPCPRWRAAWCWRQRPRVLQAHGPGAGWRLGAAARWGRA